MEFAQATGQWFVMHGLAAAVARSVSNAPPSIIAQHVVSTLHALSTSSTAIRAIKRVFTAVNVDRQLFGSSEDVTWRIQQDIGYLIYDTIIDAMSWRTTPVRKADLVRSRGRWLLCGSHSGCYCFFCAVPPHSWNLSPPAIWCTYTVTCVPPCQLVIDCLLRSHY
jgi:hypothetical protein